MKPRTKLFLLLASLLCLGVIGFVLRKIQQNAGVPFPGAIVVLNDDSWRLRGNQDWGNAGYLWAAPNIVVYKQEVRDEYRVVLRRIVPNTSPSPLKSLPLLLTEGQYVSNTAPNGRTLFIHSPPYSPFPPYQVVRADGKGKPIAVATNATQVFWSPDSKSLYAMPYPSPSPIVERYDVQTGAVLKTTINTGHDLYPACITPEGKLLCLNSYAPEHTGSPDWKWSLMEVRGKEVSTSIYDKHFPFTRAGLYLSPDGKRLLWAIHGEETTFWAKWKEKISRKQFTPHSVTRWQVTDIDGNNGRTIGIVPNETDKPRELEPQWTPDGKGVHFLQDGKLMYLAVP